MVVVDGDRAAVAAAAQEPRWSPPEPWYASHVYRPTFVHGVKTLAFELWEQLGGRSPGTVVVPAGNGTLVLGLWTGFRELAAARSRPALPAIIAVQAERCAPLAGLRPAGPTAAPASPSPSRPGAGRCGPPSVASGGRVLTAPEEDLEAARLA